MKFQNIIQEMKDKEFEHTGDCFDSSFEFMVENSIFNKIENLKLVHGVVSGQGDLSGYRYTHAWCEDDDYVYDNSNGRNLKIPKMLYYAIGNINPKQGKYYNTEQFRRMVSHHKTKGPWEIENKYYKERYNPKTGYYD